MNQTGNTLLLVLVGVLVVAGVFGAYYFGTQQNASIQPALESSPAPTATPAPSANEPEVSELFTSDTCDFTAKLSISWKGEDTKGTDQVGFDFACSYFSAPDFKFTGPDTAEGLQVALRRTLRGSEFHSVKIDTPDDYIKATETIQTPRVPVRNVQEKSYGDINGKYFEYSAFENTANFIFYEGDYIYNVRWNADYSGPHKNSIDGIIASFSFLTH